jgi:AGCS family alanine or glycine:cation symporter
MSPQFQRHIHRSTSWVLGSALTLATGSAAAQGIDQAVDAFFASAFGWFVNLIFYSVPVAGANFPLIAG